MPDQPTDTQQTSPAPRKKRSLGAWIGIVVAALVVLLVLLVALAPTIASSGWGRGLILGQVNQFLNGTVSVGNWNIGWFSNISADDVVVRDAAGREVIKLKSLQTGLTALKAARMNFDAGEVAIDGLWLEVHRDENGELNLARLVKETEDEPETDDEPAELPDISTTLVIRNSGGTFTDSAMGQTVNFGLEGQVAIANINQPIRNDLKLTTRTGDGRPGTFTLAGEVDIAENNRIQVDLTTLKQQVKATAVDLASLAAFVPPETLTTLSGVLDIDLNMQGTSDGAVTQATITIANAAVGGPALNGDVLRQKQVKITVPRTVVRLPREGEDFAKARFAIGSRTDAASLLRIAFDQGEVTLRGDLEGGALMRLADNQKPGAAGDAALSAAIDIGALAQQLPNTLAIDQQVQQLKGKLEHSTTLTLAADSATISTRTNLTDVSAVREGRQVALKPVRLEVAARSLGGGGAIPDLRDMRLMLASGFANAEITGRDLGSVSGVVRGSLDEMQREVGQFVDFGKARLAGTFEMNPSVNGSLLQAGGNANASLPITIRNLAIEGIEGQLPLRQEQVQVTLTGTLVRGGVNEPFLTAVRGSRASLLSGSQQNAVVDLALAADIEMPGGDVQIPRWEITRGQIDLAALQRDLPQVAEAIEESGARISSGRVRLSGRGAFTGSLLTLNDLAAVMENVTVQTADGRPVVDRMAVNFDTAGRVQLGDDATRINLTKLNLVEQRNYLTLKKTSGGELALVLPKDGGFAATAPGELQVGVSLGFASQLARALGAAPADASSQAGQIQQGFLDGTLRFQPQGNDRTHLAGNLNIRNLTILTGSQPLQAGDMTLVLDAATANDGSSVAVAKLDLGSRFANVNISDVQMNLAAESVVELLRSANVKLDVPDAGQAWAVKEAFVPGQPTPGADGEAPVPPLHVAAGRLNVDATVSSDNGAMIVALRNVSGDGVRLTRGQAARTLDPFNFKADARIQPKADGGLERVAVSRLEGTFGFANVALTEPLQITGLGGDRPMLAGTLRGDADLEPLMAVVNLLTGSIEPPAFAGKLAFTQGFNTQGDTVSGNIDARVSGFRTLGEGAQQINDDIQLVGGVAMNLADKSLAVNDIRLQMPKTRALDLVAKGTIQRFDTDRQLDLGLTLKTDWEKLWQIIYPLLSSEMQAELADAKAFGIDQRTYTIQGSYPAGKPMHEAIRTVTASGGFGIKSFQGMGLDIRELDAPWELKDGRLAFLAAKQTVRGQYTPNAQVNGGVLNLMNIVIDLTQPDGIRINTPKDYKLLVRASMNPLLADKIFGRFINPMLADAKQARGQVDVIIEFCENFSPAQISAGEANVAASIRQRNQDAFEAWKRQQQGGAPDAAAQAALETIAADPGRMDVRLSITQMQLGSPTLENLIGLNIANADIKDARISISRGVVKSDVGITINDQATMRFNGAVRMIDTSILNMVVAYPKTLLPSWAKEAIGDKGMRMLPEAFQLPMSGQMGAVQFDLMGAVRDNLLSQEGLGNILGDVLGGNRREQPQQQQPQQSPQQPGSQRQPTGQQPIGQQPAGPQQQQAAPRQNEPRDPLGGLIRILTEEERRKEQERERQEQGR